MNNFLEVGQKAHGKAEIKDTVTQWCANKEIPDLLKWIYLKELEVGIKLGQDILRKPARQSYLELTQGETEKKHLFGVEVSTQSTIKKQVLAKEYIYSDTVDKLVKEGEDLKKQLKLKEDAIKSLKLMEIDSGVAKEVSIEALVGEEVATMPVEDSFNIVIKLPE